MSKTSNSQEPPNGGSDKRFVRLRDAVRGQYCQFEKGEVVKLSGELDSLRMERVKWRNSLTISNVLCNVPNWLILYEDAEEARQNNFPAPNHRTATLRVALDEAQASNVGGFGAGSFLHNAEPIRAGVDFENT